MRVFLAAAALLLTALVAVPGASAGTDPDPDPDPFIECLEWDTGDYWCVLSSTPGYTCVFTVERSASYYGGVGCVTLKPTPEACALVDQNGETLCLRV